MSGQSEQNQMDIGNLSKVFAPSLLWPKAPLVQTKEDYDLCANLVELFLSNPKDFDLANPNIKPFTILDTPSPTKSQEILSDFRGES